MDKNTLSNYGWIIIAVLVLAVMIALATPFGKYIESGVRSTTAGLFDTSEKAMNVVGMSAGDGNFEDGYGEASTTNLPAKGKTLEQYSWEEARDIIAAGKASEYGFVVGSTKTLQINNATKTATIIGLNHDGSNTATFMIVSSGGIGKRAINYEYKPDEGEWKDSEMRTWLNTTIYESMTDTKAYIKEVSKDTNNMGLSDNSVSATNDKVFLLSAKEAGVEWQVSDRIDDWDWPDYSGMNALNNEGTKYAWFDGVNTINDYFWLRSPVSDYDFSFFLYNYDNIEFDGAYYEYTVCPAFVIG